MPKKSHIRTSAEQRAWQKKADEEYAAMKRWQCNILSFWRVCQERSCRRARGCAGDSRACFERWWPIVPEELKIWLRTAMTSQAKGLSPADAVNAANAEVVRCRELDKHIHELMAGTKTAPAAARGAPEIAPPDSEPVLPRVRQV